MNIIISHMEGICRIRSNFLPWICPWRCHWIANR